MTNDEQPTPDPTVRAWYYSVWHPWVSEHRDELEAAVMAYTQEVIDEIRNVPLTKISNPEFGEVEMRETVHPPLSFNAPDLTKSGQLTRVAALNHVFYAGDRAIIPWLDSEANDVDLARAKVWYVFGPLVQQIVTLTAHDIPVLQAFLSDVPPANVEPGERSPVGKPDGWTRSELVAQAKEFAGSFCASTFDNIRKAAKVMASERGGRGQQRRYSRIELAELIEAAKAGTFRKKAVIASSWRELLGK